MNTIWLKLNDEKVETIGKWISRVIQFIIIPLAGVTVWWVQNEIKTYGQNHFMTKAEYQLVLTSATSHSRMSSDEIKVLATRMNANDTQTAIALANLQSEVRNISNNMKEMKDDIREIRRNK